MDYQQLIEMAEQARKNAYCPYSEFSVGAALLTEDGSVYTGCNVENAAFGPGSCAERTAFFKAVSEGVRDFKAIAIVGGKKAEEGGYCAPCGVCRQVMAEFCNLEAFEIVLKREASFCVYKLRELLPEAFGPDNINKG